MTGNILEDARRKVHVWARDEWPSVGLLVTAIDMSSSKHGNTTLRGECHYDNPALLTMPPEPERLPPTVIPVFRNEVHLSLPSLCESW